MIGLDITLSKKNYKNLIHKILNGIDLLNYKWYIYEDQILYDENGEIKQGIFNADVLSGEEFVKCISRRGYWFVFVDIKAYKIGNKSVVIETFKDFLSSDCELVILCIDSTYVSIYCKNRNILDIIYNNCANCEFEKVCYISYDEALGRELIAF
jgi:hypothetical protein